MSTTDRHFELSSVLYGSLTSYWNSLQNERPLDQKTSLTIETEVVQSDAFKSGRRLVEELILSVGSSSASWLEQWKNRSSQIEKLKAILEPVVPMTAEQMLLSASLFAYCANTSDLFHPDDYFEAARLYRMIGDHRRAGEAYLAAIENASSLLGFELSSAIYKEAAQEFLLAGELQLADHALFLRMELAIKNGDYDRKIFFMRELLEHFQQTSRLSYAGQLAAQIEVESRMCRSIAQRLEFAERAKKAGDTKGEISARLAATELWLQAGSIDYAKRSYLQAIRAAESAGQNAEAAKLKFGLIELLSGLSTSSYREKADILFSAAKDLSGSSGVFYSGSAISASAKEALAAKAFSKAVVMLLPFALHPSAGGPDRTRIVEMIIDGGSGDRKLYDEMRAILWPELNKNAKFALLSNRDKKNIVAAYLEIATAVAEKMASVGNISLALSFMFETLGDVKTLTYPGSPCRAMAGRVVIDFADRITAMRGDSLGILEKLRLWYTKRTLRYDLIRGDVPSDDGRKVVEMQIEPVRTPSSADVLRGVADLEKLGRYEQAALAKFNNLGPALEAEGNFDAAIKLYEELSTRFLAEAKNANDPELEKKNALLADALCRRGRLMVLYGDKTRGDVERGGALLNTGYALYGLLLKNEQAADGANSWPLIYAVTELVRAGRAEQAFTLLDMIAVPKSVSPEAFEYIFDETLAKESGDNKKQKLEFLKKASRLVFLAYGREEAERFIERLSAKGSAGLFAGKKRLAKQSMRELRDFIVAAEPPKLRSRIFPSASDRKSFTGGVALRELAEARKHLAEIRFLERIKRAFGKR